MAAKRRRGKRTRAQKMQGTLAIGGVFALLVGINVYVFLLRPGNVKDLQRKVAAGRMAQGALPGASEPAPGQPLPVGGAALPGGVAGKGAPGASTVVPVLHGRRLEGKVGKGDTLGKILEREGLTRPEAAELSDALKGALDLKSIREGQAYALTLDDEGNLVAFEYRVSPAVLVRVERGVGGKLKALRSETKTEIQLHEVSGVIASSLYEAVRSRGESTELVADLADLFASDINFFIDTHEGDRFSLVVEKEYLNGEFFKYGRILAAEYHGEVGTYRAFWWQGQGVPRGGYFDEKGQSLTKSLLKTPLKFARLSSGFNPKRMHPVLHRVKGHFGTDYAAPVGTPVWASQGGRVVSCSPAGGAGNLVVLDHGGGLKTYYMHLSRFASGLRAGQSVEQKQVIGYVGTTGLSTGPHLHFGVQVNGKWVDSTKLTPRRAAPVPRGSMGAFQATIAPQVAALSRLRATPPARETATASTAAAMR
jgi:murein DD-endopeptidase MepM/ murein hydrolase activator NlpD